MNTKIFIGIAGGTASGKSAIAKHLLNHFQNTNCAIIKVHSYYYDLADLSMKYREKTNFDHPNSIDFNYLIEDLKKLNQNEKIDIPIYDYKTHTRTKNYYSIDSQQIIIIEGLFALYNQKIKEILNLKIFVDTKESIRLERRIKRDLRKRKRTYSSIINQFNNMVTPMHNKYVEPTKSYANLIIPR